MKEFHAAPTYVRHMADCDDLPSNSTARTVPQKRKNEKNFQLTVPTVPGTCSTQRSETRPHRPQTLPPFRVDGTTVIKALLPPILGISNVLCRGNNTHPALLVIFILIIRTDTGPAGDTNTISSAFPLRAPLILLPPIWIACLKIFQGIDLAPVFPGAPVHERIT